MKTLEFIYQDTEIHFLVNNNDKNVMINATEMAKAFEKRTDNFLRGDHAKAFIEALKLPHNRGSLSDENIIQFRGRSGLYFHRALALKFAAWLDPHFEVWVFRTIETLVFGNYKKHWDAHMEEETAKNEMEKHKAEMLKAPSKENVQAYFLAESKARIAKSAKASAMRNQLKLFSGSAL